MDSSTSNPPVDPDLGNSPVELLQHLIRFDTTNPPGNEKDCIGWITELLSSAGYETKLYSSDQDRPNLVARLEGEGSAPPLLFYGHADVVPANEDEWDYPPFEATQADGFIWGRGTLDMKGPLAMMLSAAIQAAQNDLHLGGDLVVAIFADEEAGGDEGASFMVNSHPEALEDVRYAIGEFGGFSLSIRGQRFYPIQVAEKTVCWIELTFNGPAGHGSLPQQRTAVADMARTVAVLSESRLPVHITPTVEEMISTIAAKLPGSSGEDFRRLLEPEHADDSLSRLDEFQAMFDALLHNTANPTIVNSGEKENVVPSEATVTVDCRLLPGFTSDDLQRELLGIIPDDVNVDISTIRYDAHVIDGDIDMGLFPLLSDTLQNNDPDGEPFPFVSFGATDAKHLANIGIQSYGFTPMMLPPDLDFLETLHAPNERIPVTAVEFGADCMREVLSRYGPDVL